MTDDNTINPTNDTTNEAVPAKPEGPFDQELSGAGQLFALEMLSRHPELRSVAIVFDYQGQLNDAAVIKAMFRSSTGVQATPEAIFGTMNNTIRLIDFLAKSAGQAVNGIQRAASEAGQQALAFSSQAEEKAKNVESLAREEQRLQARVDVLRELGKIPEPAHEREIEPEGHGVHGSDDAVNDNRDTSSLTA